MGDVDSGKKMYDYYSDVHDREEPHFLSLRSTVLDRKQPRRMFAQHNTVLEGKSYPVFYVHYHCYQSVSIPSPPLRKILMLLGNITVDYSPPSGVHGSVVIGVKPKTKRSLVQTLQWSLDVVYYALRKGTLSTLAQSTNMTLGTGLCWELT